jgi:hypothetical protein
VLEGCIKNICGNTGEWHMMPVTAAQDARAAVSVQPSPINAALQSNVCNQGIKQVARLSLPCCCAGAYDGRSKI